MVHVSVIAVVAALVGATGGFFLRKRSSGWCPTCGGPAQLRVACAAAELLEREATEKAAPGTTVGLQQRFGAGISGAVLASPRLAVGRTAPSNPR